MFPKSRVPCRLSPQIIVISLIDKPPCRPIQTGLSPCSYSLTSPQQMPLTNSIIVYMQLNNILNIIFTFRDKTTIISDVVTSQQAPTKNCVLPSTNIPNWTTTMMRLFISPPPSLWQPLKCRGLIEVYAYDFFQFFCARPTRQHYILLEGLQLSKLVFRANV